MTEDNQNYLFSSQMSIQNFTFGSTLSYSFTTKDIRKKKKNSFKKQTLEYIYILNESFKSRNVARDILYYLLPFVLQRTLNRITRTIE